MKHRFVTLLSLCLFPLLAAANFPPINVATTIIPAPPHLAAKSYILVDFLSDYVLVEQDVDQRVEPASLTKMMTVYVVDAALKNNKIQLTDEVSISEKAWRSTGSRMFVDVNAKIKVGDLLKGVIIQSGNDASIALAEHIAGSETAFADIMNHYAKEHGMVNTHFVNSTGMPDPNHYTTARDLAILAKAIIRDFPETYALYAEKEFVHNNIKQPNRNRLLWRHQWVDGIKTGFTEAAGYCLVASGQQQGMRLIAIVMGTQNDNARTDETDKLLNYGFRFFETRRLYPGNTPVKQSRVWMGKKKEVGLGLANDFYVTIGRGQYDRLRTNINVEKVIKAPFEQGTILGTLSVQLDDKTIAEKPIVALNAVAKSNIIARSYDNVELTAKSLWEKAGF